MAKNMAEREKPGVLSALFKIAENFAHAQKEISAGSEKAAAYRKVKPVEDLTKQIRERVLKQEAILEERKKARRFYEQTKPDPKKPGTTGHISNLYATPEGWLKNHATLGLDKTGTPRSIEESRFILKTALAANPKSREILAQFGVASEADLHSPQAAEYLAKYLLLPDELRHDPHIQYQLLAELAVSVPHDADHQSFQEYYRILKGGREALRRARDAAKESGFELSDREIDIKFSEQGAGLPTASPPEVYNESDPTKETVIINTDLVGILKDANYTLKHDPLFQHDNRRLTEVKKDIIQLGRENNIPDAQIQEAVGRINRLITEAEYQRAGGEAREWHRHSGTLGLSDADRELVRLRPNGHQEVLDRLLSIVDANPSAEWREAAAGLQYKLTELQELVRHKFKDDPVYAEAEAIRIGVELGVREKVHEMSRITSEGKFEDIMKIWGHIGPEDFDHLLGSAEFTPQALSAYDSAIRSRMTEINNYWDALEKRIQDRAREILADPSETTERKKTAKGALANPSKEEDGDFGLRFAIAKELFGERSKDLLDWRMGKTIRPEDVQVSGELSHIIRKEKAILFKQLQDKVRTGATLTHDEERIWNNEALREKYKSDYLQQLNWLKSRGLTEADLALTHEDYEILRIGTLTPIDKRAYDTLKSFLETKGVPFTEGELRKSIIAARNFSIITLHQQALIASLSELAPGGAGTPEWWVSTPYEDTIRALFKRRWLEERYRIGGASGEAFRILRSGYEPVVKEIAPNGAPVYKKGKRLIDRASAEKYEALIQLRKKAGIDYEAIGMESTFALGGDLDATTWRARIAVLNKQSDEHHGLGFQIQESKAGSPERINLIRRLFERDPLCAMHYFPREVRRILITRGVTEAQLPTVWDNLEKALSIFELEVTYDRKYSQGTFMLDATVSGAPRHGLPDGVTVRSPDLLPSIFEKVGVSSGDRDRYIAYVESIVSNMTSDTFLDEASRLELPFAMVISDNDWSKTNFASLGAIEHQRRQRDVLGGWRANVGEMKILDDPSPLNQEDFWKNIKEVQAGMQEYLGKEDPRTNFRVYQNLWAYLEWNRNQLEWIPGWATLSGLLPTSWNTNQGLSYERALRFIFPHASYARSRKGTHAPAMDVFARDHFVDYAQRLELMTDLRLFDKLRRQQKTHLGWQTLYFLRWALPILATSMVVLAFQESRKDEK